MKNIAFFGSHSMALPLLNYLLEDEETKDLVNVVGVFTQPDRPTGRGQKLQAGPIKVWAQERNIPFLQPEKVSEVENQWLKDKAVDLVLVMAYGHILKEDILSVPSCGMVNFHVSLLPKYRGASPIEAAIAQGERETGVSLMQIVRKMDAGAVYDQEKVNIEPNDTAIEVTDKLAIACVPLLKRNLKGLLNKTAAAQEQDESQVSYTRKLTKMDGYLDFNLDAKTLVNRARALHPWPGSFFMVGEDVIKSEGIRVFFKNDVKEILNLMAFDFTQDILSQKEGTVLGKTSEGNIMVKVGQGTIITIGYLQRPGGRMLEAREFTHGYPLEKGAYLKGAVAQGLVQNRPFLKAKL